MLKYSKFIFINKFHKVCTIITIKYQQFLMKKNNFKNIFYLQINKEYIKLWSIFYYKHFLTYKETVFRSAECIGLFKKWLWIWNINIQNKNRGLYNIIHNCRMSSFSVFSSSKNVFYFQHEWLELSF